MAKPETKPKELKPKANVEEVGPCKLKITVQIAAAKVKERIDQRYKDLSDSVALPGFRKGKAPRNLLERKFGKALLVELKGELLQDSYEEVREDIEAVGLVQGAPLGPQRGRGRAPAETLRGVEGTLFCGRGLPGHRPEVTPGGERGSMRLEVVS